MAGRDASTVQDVQDYYDRNVDREWNRLAAPLQRVELASTLRLIETYFPASGRICDIGSGPGRYAIELAKRGYRVTLVDLAEQLLARARREFDGSGLTAERCIQSNATDLRELEDGAYDAALLLGPLYHLTTDTGRHAALMELKRILKPGGVAIVAYLNTWGIMRTGIADMATWYRDVATLRSMLTAHGYSSEQLAGFTSAHWSTPPDALKEVERAGFATVSYAGAEGFCGGMWPMVAALAERDPVAFENVVTVAAETSELPQYRDATDHLHIVVRRP